MKKITLALAALAAVFTISTQQAEARVAAPLWTCNLGFDIKGGGVKILLGSFELKGPGRINCVDVAGNQEVIPVKVTLGGTPLSATLGVGRMRLMGVATGIGLAGQPADLLGDYVVGGVRGSIFVGAGADVALHAAHRSFTINTALQAVSGFGVNMGFDYLTIEAR